MSHTLIALAEVEALSARLRAEGRCLVVTNGHFDLLHVGHVRYLQAARALGDELLVGVNCDEATRRAKGSHRPIVPADERAELLAALACVDYVCIFDTLTAEELVRLARPAVYAKGGDYRDPDGGYSRLPEAAVALEHGGRVALLPFVEGSSTTALIERILVRYGGSA